jgi:hypothetical protein
LRQVTCDPKRLHIEFGVGTAAGEVRNPGVGIAAGDPASVRLLGRYATPALIQLLVRYATRERRRMRSAPFLSFSFHLYEYELVVHCVYNF